MNRFTSYKNNTVFVVWSSLIESVKDIAPADLPLQLWVTFLLYLCLSPVNSGCKRNNLIRPCAEILH